MYKNPHILLKIFFILILSVVLRLFSLKGIDVKIFQYLELLLLGILLFLCIINTRKIRGLFSKNFSFIALFTFTASFPAYIFHGQSFFLSFFASRVILYILIYRFLHIFNFKADFVLKVLFYIGWVWVVIMIIQNFTFPNVLFRIRDLDVEDTLIRARGEVLRLNIQGVRYGVFLLLSLVVFATNNLKKYAKIFYLVIIAFALSLTGTRQIIFSVIFLTFLIFLNPNKGKIAKRGFFLLVILPVLFLSSSYIYIYFEALITKTNDDLNLDYIRLLEINFYVFEYWPKQNAFIAYIFGNGWEHGQSEYGQEILINHQEYLHFFRGDIGILGAFNKFGILYIISVIALFYKFLKFKYTVNNIFIKYFFLFLVITYFTGGNFLENESVILLIACCAFILDKSIKQKQQVLK